MLSKDKRLNLKKDFKRVASGKKLETKYLKLFVSFGDNQIPKIGIAVSGKTFKKAAKRNRARRLASAVFEALYLSLPPSINILVLPKASVAGVKSGNVLLDTEAILKNEKIIH